MTDFFEAGEGELLFPGPKCGSGSIYVPPLLALRGVVCWNCRHVRNLQPKMEEEEEMKRGRYIEWNLSKCSRCRRAWFCSKRCQMESWAGHKPFCKVMAKLVSDPPAGAVKPTNREEWSACVSAKKKHLERIVGGYIGYTEQRALLDEAHCETCFATRDEQVLTPCKSCLSVFGCQQHHDLRDVHSAEDCAKYRDLVRFDQFDTNFQADEEGDRFFSCSELREVEHFPKGFPSDWSEYFAWRMEAPDCHDDSGFRDSSFVRGLSTDMLSMPLSVLSALRHFSLLGNHQLVIHLVGVDRYEIPSSSVFDEILHVLPALERLYMVFIGPEAPFTHPEVELAVCEPCSTAGVKIFVKVEQLKYEEYLFSHSRQAKPDLVVAFNSGVGDPDLAESWKPALLDLAKLQVPCLFTSPSLLDATKDREVLVSSGYLLVSASADRNPFASLRLRPTCAALRRSSSRFECSNEYVTLCVGQGPSGPSQPDHA